MNWNDPAERAELIERVGPEEYNRLITKHQRDSIVATVNGYSIRPVVSARLGQIFMIDPTGTGYAELERAKAEAAKLPPAAPLPA